MKRIAKELKDCRVENGECRRDASLGGIGGNNEEDVGVKTLRAGIRRNTS